MISLGTPRNSKADVVIDYICHHRDIERVIVLGPSEFDFEFATLPVEYVDYPQIYTHVVFHRLMQEINNQTLLVINECLRTRNRYDLTYNVIRQYLNLTTHQIVFQRLPIIADRQDFMTLLDWDTRSRWKREAFRPELLREAHIVAQPEYLRFEVEQVAAPDKLHDAYAKKRTNLFASIGAGDPDKIPRQLYQLGAKARITAVLPDWMYLGTRKIIPAPNVVPYGKAPRGENGVFELPFRFGDFRDHLTRHHQTCFPVIASDLKADQWFMRRYQEWTKEVQDVLSLIG